MRRGFKSEAERIAVEQRTEMGLAPTERLDPFALAEFLGVPVFSFAQCARALSDSSRVQLLRTRYRSSVSAMTLVTGHRRIIVFNDRNARTRQASDVAHEFGHILLEHPPLVVDERDWDKNRSPALELEATWFGGALLIPREGLLGLLADGMEEANLARHFGVSTQLLRWRVNATGVRLQLARRRAF